MAEKDDITVNELNKSLKKIGHDARRVNKALGRNTIYEKDGWLVKITPSGEKRRYRPIQEDDKTSHGLLAH